jgi:hypothetical protein
VSCWGGLSGGPDCGAFYVLKRLKRLEDITLLQRFSYAFKASMARAGLRDENVTKNSQSGCHAADVPRGSQRHSAQTGYGLIDILPHGTSAASTGGGVDSHACPPRPALVPQSWHIPKDESDNIHYGNRPP